MLTKAQRIHLMGDLWPAACRAQGWDRNDRELRLTILSHAVQRELASANDLDRKGDFDRVKAALLHLADNVRGTVETDHPELGEQRRLLWLVENKLRPKLARYVKDPDAYIQAVIRDKFGVVRGLSTLEDLSADAEPGQTPELMQLVITLTARIKSLGDAAIAEADARAIAAVDAALAVNVSPLLGL